MVLKAESLQDDIQNYSSTGIKVFVHLKDYLHLTEINHYFLNLFIYKEHFTFQK